MIIYKITNLVTGKVYIGQTIMPLIRRWQVHKSAKRRSPLSSSLKKHGSHNFIIEPICSALHEDHLDYLEEYFIDYYKCVYPLGYNLMAKATIGANTRGMPPWNKGRKASPEAIKNQAEAHKGQIAWNKGLTTPRHVRAKLSAAKLGKHMSPNTEFKKGQESMFKGRKHTQEALAKISANGNRRAVLCIETGQLFSSILQASRLLGIAKSHLCRLIINGTKHKKTGFTFSFVDKS